jgi:HSP20 family protein
MAKAETQVPVKTEAKGTPAPAPTEGWGLSSLRREIDRVFEDFHRRFRGPFNRPLMADIEPFLHPGESWGAPAVDVADKDKAYEITAELPGLDGKNVEVTVANGMLTIKGEKQEKKEENTKGYFFSERHYGSFQRSFRVPDGVDANKIEASLKNGLLTVTLPKTPEAQKPGKKIEVKSA